MALNDPAAWQGVVYTDAAGTPVVDYMTSIPDAKAKDADALDKVIDSKLAVMVSAYDGEQAAMVYLKPPPDGYVFTHEYAGTSVGAEPVAVVETPLEKPLDPLVIEPVQDLGLKG
jgi:hypothetical protein